MRLRIRRAQAVYYKYRLCNRAHHILHVSFPLLIYVCVESSYRPIYLYISIYLSVIPTYVWLCLGTRFGHAHKAFCSYSSFARIASMDISHGIPLPTTIGAQRPRTCAHITLGQKLDTPNCCPTTTGTLLQSIREKITNEFMYSLEHRRLQPSTSCILSLVLVPTPNPENLNPKPNPKALPP